MVAGGLMDRELGAEVARRVEPWVELVEGSLRRLLPSSAARRLPLQEAAYGIVASFLGLEILGNLADDHRRGDAVIERVTADRAACARRPARRQRRSQDPGRR
jgi:hypothetical protein